MYQSSALQHAFWQPNTESVVLWEEWVHLICAELLPAYDIIPDIQMKTTVHIRPILLLSCYKLSVVPWI